MTSKIRRQYGIWDSSITAGSLASGTRLSDVAWSADGEALVWIEGRSAQGVVVVLESRGDAPRDLTGDLNVRAEVGYGGGDFTVGRDCVFYVVQGTGRIHRQPLAGGTPRPIIPGFGKAASPVLSPDGRWLAYVHHDQERVDRLAIVDAEGRHWPQILASGHDFYMQPRWSPDGCRMAWIAWDHPRMPWDGTRLYTATVVCDGDRLPTLEDVRAVAGGDDIAVFQPEFTADSRSLVYISDEAGWGRLSIEKLDGGAPARCLTSGDVEYGAPAWGQGMRTYTLSPDGRVAICACNRRGFVGLERLTLADGSSEEVPGLEDYADIAQLTAAPGGDRVAFVASGPHTPPRVVVHDFESGETRVVARSLGETVPLEDLSSPESLSWETEGGESAHGIYYPPASSRFEGTGHPPLIVMVHGGPTGQVRAGWSSQAQFFATRGYGVLYVNYRGSTGYGREYMLRLRRNWGICDVEDAISGAKHLAQTGRVDPERTAIMGGSAGGFTVLHTLVTQPEAFAAGVCLYGVSNQFSLAADTHKFEERYLDSILGPLPEASEIYRERSPIFHADRIRRPLAVFQGEIDQVVPRDQSDTIVEALKRSGTPHAYHVYEGEGHGWRKRETVEHFYTEVERFLREHLIYS